MGITSRTRAIALATAVRVGFAMLAAVAFPCGSFAETRPGPVVDQATPSLNPPLPAVNPQLVAMPAPPAPTPSVSAAAGLLPDDLSPWGMFMHADIVVQIVICGLALASMVTWTTWLAKTLELAVAKRRLRRAYRALRDARSLTVANEWVAGANSGVARALVREATEEWRRSADVLDDRDGLKERIALQLERVEAITGRRMMIGTGILATIGSTSPFVGLFGTVWGIMNSFVGISRMHTTNLAVVAPGIAEALLATACGLVAAIPAVVIYNHFVRQIAAYKALVASSAATVMTLVSRDLSHGERVVDIQTREPAATPERTRPRRVAVE
jgi:biopolymer transport protein ExbB